MLRSLVRFQLAPPDPKPSRDWACRLTSEHPVRVGRFLGYFLDNVPVLHDFAIFQSEEIRPCTTGLAWLQDQMGMSCNRVALSDDPLDLEAQPGMLI